MKNNNRILSGAGLTPPEVLSTSAPERDSIGPGVDDVSLAVCPVLAPTDATCDLSACAERRARGGCSESGREELQRFVGSAMLLTQRAEL